MATEVRPRALIVQDEEDLRRATAVLLNRRGFEVLGIPRPSTMALRLVQVNLSVVY
jgi:DNA-binding response OmpR family regulator